MNLEDSKKGRILFVVLAAIGGVGVFGQLSLLHNTLVHSYPFKMMDMPPADFYSAIGSIGFYIAAIAAAVTIFISAWLPRFLTSALPVVVCPLAYWLVFEVAHLFRGFSQDQMLERNFSGYTGHTARFEFGFEILVLLVFGAIIGSVIGYAAVKLTTVRANKLA